MADQNDISYRPPTWVSQGVSILNGMFGDYLHHRGNGLAIRMDCYHRDQPLALDRESLKAAYPEATRKLCVLIHGLGCNEGIWTFADDAAQHDAGTSYGTLLQRDAGYTPLFVRYNSGLPIADNARDLATL